MAAMAPLLGAQPVVGRAHESSTRRRSLRSRPGEGTLAARLRLRRGRLGSLSPAPVWV